LGFADHETAYIPDHIQKIVHILAAHPMIYTARPKHFLSMDPVPDRNTRPSFSNASSSRLFTAAAQRH